RRIGRHARNTGWASCIERVVRLVGVPLQGQFETPRADVADVEQPRVPQLPLDVKRPLQDLSVFLINDDRIQGWEERAGERRRDEEVLEEEPRAERQPAARWRRFERCEHRGLVIEQVSLAQLEKRRVEALLEIKLTHLLVVIDAEAGADDRPLIAEGQPGKADSRPEIVAVRPLK